MRHVEADERSSMSAQDKATPTLPNECSCLEQKTLRSCAVIHLGGGSVVRILMDVEEVTKYATKTGEMCC